MLKVSYEQERELLKKVLDWNVSRDLPRSDFQVIAVDIEELLAEHSRGIVYFERYWS